MTVDDSFRLQISGPRSTAAMREERMAVCGKGAGAAVSLLRCLPRALPALSDVCSGLPVDDHRSQPRVQAPQLSPPYSRSTDDAFPSD